MTSSRDQSHCSFSGRTSTEQAPENPHRIRTFTPGDDAYTITGFTTPRKSLDVAKLVLIRQGAGMSISPRAHARPRPHDQRRSPPPP